MRTTPTVNAECQHPADRTARRHHGVSGRHYNGRRPICRRASPAWRSALDARLPKTPKYKVAFFPQYDYYLASKADLRLMAAYTYTAEMCNDSLNTPQLWRPPTRNLDARSTTSRRTRMYDFAVGGSNLTNDRYVTAGSPNYGAGEVGGYFNPPRMWYASIRSTEA